MQHDLSYSILVIVIPNLQTRHRVT